MAILTNNCPRCGAQNMTFDVLSCNVESYMINDKSTSEAFSICRGCLLSTVFFLNLKNKLFSTTRWSTLIALSETLNTTFDIIGYVSQVHESSIKPPDHLPPDVLKAFEEAARCLSVNSFNGAGGMFRLCIDLTTKSMLSQYDKVPEDVQKNLAKRLSWLFSNNHLPNKLEKLCKCIRKDGNDGLHDGSLTKVDAEDLADFTYWLLESVYTLHKKVEIAIERNDIRNNILPQVSHES